MIKKSTHMFEFESTEHAIAIEIGKDDVQITSIDTTMTHDEFREFADEIGKIFTPIRKRRATKADPKSPATEDMDQ